MHSRRQFLAVVGTSGLLAPVVVWLGAGRPDRTGQARAYPRQLSDAIWRGRLSPEVYHVLREAGTERPFSSLLHQEHRAGRYRCRGCGDTVFEGSAKYDSGTGWPSFVRPAVSTAIETHVDRRYYQIRTEVRCASCGSHLGHVFPDGPAPTGLRYCINGIALTFEPTLL